jgi:hypothetical protein
MDESIYSIEPKDTPFICFLSLDLQTVIKFSGVDPKVSDWAWKINTKRIKNIQRYEWLELNRTVHIDSDE